MHPSSERILEHYTPERAAEYAARGWYTLARLEARRLARKHGTTLRVAAGVIAAAIEAERTLENALGSDGFDRDPEDLASIALAPRDARGEHPTTLF